jgi:hypothetical protein
MRPWALQVKSLGRWQASVEPAVLQKSHFIYCIGIEHRPLMFFGLIPTSLATKSGFIWIHLANQPTRAELRSLVRWAPAFFFKLGWDFIAFAKRDLTREVRFMEFFGLEKASTTEDYIYYRSTH